MKVNEEWRRRSSRWAMVKDTALMTEVEYQRWLAEPAFPEKERTRWQRIKHGMGCRGPLGNCPEHGWMRGMSRGALVGIEPENVDITIDEEP